MTRAFDPLTSENSPGPLEQLSDYVRLSSAVYDYLCRIRAEAVSPVLRCENASRRFSRRTWICGGYLRQRLCPTGEL